MLLYYIKYIMKYSGRKTQRRNQKTKKTQRKNRKSQKNQKGGMAGVLNTALVPFGILAMQKYKQGRVMKRKLRKTRRRKSSKK